MNDRRDILLHYNPCTWREQVAVPQNTLQIFITNRCNLRCPECFYSQWLGASQMPFDTYRTHIERYRSQVAKVILLGGEPTLHRELPQMIEYNLSIGLNTTIYTNGFRLKILKSLFSDSEVRKRVSLRIGVHGLTVSEKPLIKVQATPLPITIVYMLARYNKHELMNAAHYAERNFNCSGFYISSIREIDKTLDFWKDTEATLSMPEYAEIAQKFIDEYDGGIPILHISTRGVLITQSQKFTAVKGCRIGSILCDGSTIISPLDISLARTTAQLSFNNQLCQRHHKCILQKIVLCRI